MEEWRSLKYGDRPIYPETLIEQEAALLTDSQLLDYKRIRREKARDPHRPLYHFVRPDGFLNDPNGLCFWEGRWHLFYQAGGSGCIHWGHAVSEDMVHWRDLPYAIYPEPEPYCFSGGTCVDRENHRVIAAYYGYSGYDLENGYKHGIMVATSSDPLLLNWTKVNGGNAVIPDRDAPCWTPPDAPPVEGQKPYQVFDAYIWKEDGVYYILTAGYEPDPVTGRRFRQMHLLRCTDDSLENWEFVRHFLDRDRFRELGDDGACPYFLPIGDDKHLLLHFSHRGVAKYLLGNYDPTTKDFAPFSAGRFTSGYGVMVAPSAYPLQDGSGDVAVIFNTPEQMNHDGWYGIMTLPRRLSVGGAWKDELHQSPIDAVESLRGEHRSFANIPLKEGEPLILQGIGGGAFELQIRLSPDNVPQTFEVDVLRSPDGDETTKITFYKNKGGMYAILPYNTDSVIELDASRSSRSPAFSPNPVETALVVKEADEDLVIRIFADRSIVEVFVNGKTCLSSRAYPTDPDNTVVSLRARGGDITVDELHFWKMDSIWEE